MKKPVLILLAVAATALFAGCSKKTASPETAALAAQLQGSGLVLADFTSDSSTANQEMRPIIEKAVAKYEGKIQLITVDIEKHPQLAAGYLVTTLPHYVIMNGSVYVTNYVGTMSESDFAKWLDAEIATQR